MSDLVDESGSSGDLSFDEDIKIVTARGTEDGLVLRIDGRADWKAVVGELEEFLGSRKKFLEGGEVSIEWLDRLPTKEQSTQLEEFLRDRYGIEVLTGRRKPERTTFTLEMKGREKKRSPGSPTPTGVAVSLFEEQLESPRVAAEAAAEFILEDIPSERSKSYLNKMSKLLGDDVLYGEDANAKILYTTLRSGQRIETPFSLVVVGDVNPGADLVAGGDIFVIGSLRGTAHAGAYDDDSQDRMIFAFQMRPMQLRIGSVISRGGDEVGGGPEVARIDSRRIVVEPFNPRALNTKRFRFS